MVADKKSVSQPKPEAVSENNVKPLPPPPPETPDTGVNNGHPHAFVVMPFGLKQDAKGRWIDFNSIYENLIKVALIEAGFEPFRADEESVSGDILTDMFQELLLADLVIADLSIDNANVFYELGVRHALRKRGLIHIQSGRAYMPFDVFNVRTLPYHCDDEGKPDPQYLEKDRSAIAKMAKATWDSAQNRIHSPIFNLLDGLEEPDRKTLRTPLAVGYWDEYNNWQKRVTIATRQDYLGDILLLTEEMKNPFIKCEAIPEAGKALKRLGNHQLALQQYQQGLILDPKNSTFRTEEAFHLSRLQRYDEAVVKLEWLLKDEPHNIECYAYLGDIYKEMWKQRWTDQKTPENLKKAAYSSSHLLHKAIEIYVRGFRLDQNHYTCGINALMLSSIFKYLADEVGVKGDHEAKAVKSQLPSLSGAVEFSLTSAALKDSNNVWVFLYLGNLAACTARNSQQVTYAYKQALNLLWNNKFALQSIIDQLKLAQSLGFRVDYVQAGLDVLEAELKRMTEHENFSLHQGLDQSLSQVFLFSGHMIDAPHREEPRFPPQMEAEARQKIKMALDKLEADGNDLAIASGIACGGDILFLEECLERQMKVEVYLPFKPPKFIQESVSFAESNWVERFYKIKNHPQVERNLYLQPDRLGEVPEGEDPFERNNRWSFYSTLMYGIEKVRLVVLWNGKSGDGPGGTGDMVRQVRRLGGIVEHIDTTKFDYWKQLSVNSKQ
jgi:tetratricopeptide (TPR) repeat protein